MWIKENKDEMHKTIKISFFFFSFFIIRHTMGSIIFKPKWRIMPLEHFVSGSATLQNLCPLFSEVLEISSLKLLHIRIKWCWAMLTLNVLKCVESNKVSCWCIRCHRTLKCINTRFLTTPNFNLLLYGAYVLWNQFLK